MQASASKILEIFEMSILNLKKPQTLRLRLRILVIEVSIYHLKYVCEKHRYEIFQCISHFEIFFNKSNKSSSLPQNSILALNLPPIVQVLFAPE